MIALRPQKARKRPDPIKCGARRHRSFGAEAGEPSHQYASDTLRNIEAVRSLEQIGEGSGSLFKCRRSYSS